MTSVRSDTLWNAAASIVPAILAVATIPLLLDRAGVERFGAITILWAIIAYFSVFDLGIGRAIGRYMTAPETRDPSAVYRAGLRLSAVVGGIGGVITLVALPSLFDLLSMDESVRREVKLAGIAMALAVPAITLGSAAAGALEARRRFRKLSLINIPTMLAMQAAPLLILPFSSTVHSMIGGMVITRWGGTVALLIVNRDLLVDETGSSYPVSGLVRFGGWLTVTNVLGPILTTADRFVLGATGPVSRVATYSVAMDPTARMNIIGHSLGRALFPRLSAAGGSLAVRRMYERSFRLLLGGVILLSVGLFVAIPSLFEIWVGADLGADAAPIARVLLVGALASTVAALPTYVLYALDKPHIPSLLHALELPPYLIALALLSHNFGVTGAALAWTMRSSLDCLLLWAISNRHLDGPAQSRAMRARLVAPVVSLCILTASTWLAPGQFVIVTMAFWSMLTVSLGIALLVPGPLTRRPGSQVGVG